MRLNDFQDSQRGPNTLAGQAAGALRARRELRTRRTATTHAGISGNAAV